MTENPPQIDGLANIEAARKHEEDRLARLHVALEAENRNHAEIRRAFDEAQVIGGTVNGDEKANKRPPARKSTPKAPAAPIIRNSWVDHLKRDHKQQPFPNVSNALVALREAPEIAETFAFNKMKHTIILSRPIPGVNSRAEIPAGNWSPTLFEDFHASQVQEWMQAEIPMIGFGVVHQAVEVRARERGFHPIRNYPESLAWDRRQRLDMWLSYYLGATDSEYHRAVGRMFLIGMVARIYEPGCKLDYCPIFEGIQGVKKSTLCSVLAGGPEYFSDDLPDLRTKDARQHLRGYWLIEIAELAAVWKSNLEVLKAFMTRRNETYRPAYGRANVLEPRQNVFAGTTNAGQYLKDETGNRRFWPIKTGAIDVDALAHDRDQLFAEATHLYKNNTTWWPENDFEWEHIRPVQESRMEDDSWKSAIFDYLEGKSSVFVREVGVHAIGLQTKELGTTSDRRIAAILHEAGWSRSEKPTNRGTPWVRPSYE